MNRIKLSQILHKINYLDNKLKKIEDGSVKIRIKDNSKKFNKIINKLNELEQKISINSNKILEIEKEKLEKERLEKERQEQERLEKERLEKNVKYDFNLPERNDNEIRLIYCGTLRDEENILEIIEEFQKIHNERPEVLLKIVYNKIHGAQTFNDKINIFIKNGIKGITFKNNLSHRDTCYEIATSDIGICWPKNGWGDNGEVSSNKKKYEMYGKEIISNIHLLNSVGIIFIKSKNQFNLLQKNKYYKFLKKIIIIANYDIENLNSKYTLIKCDEIKFNEKIIDYIKIIKKYKYLTIINLNLDYNYNIIINNLLSLEKKYDIIYFTYTCLPDIISGYTIRTKNIISSYNNNNIKTLNLCRPDENKYFIINDTKSNIKYINFTFFVNKIKIKSYSFILEFFAKIYNIQLIQSASNYTLPLSAVKCSERINIKTIYEVRGLWYLTKSVNNNLNQNLIKKQIEYEKKNEIMACKSSDYCFVLNNSLKNYLIKNDIDEDKIIILPNSCFEKDLLFKPFKNIISNRKINIGYIGSDVCYEGILECLDAIDNNQIKNELNFHLVGSNNNYNYSFVKNYNKIPNDNIKSIFNLLDIIIIPRLSNELTEIVGPLKINEALGFGKLVLCSDLEPFKENIIDNFNGYLFKKNNFNNFIVKLTEIINLLKTNIDKINFVLKNNYFTIKNCGLTFDCIIPKIKKIFNSFNDTNIISLYRQSLPYKTSGYDIKNHRIAKLLKDKYDNRCKFYTKLGFPYDRLEDIFNKDDVNNFDIIDSIKYNRIFDSKNREYNLNNAELNEWLLKSNKYYKEIINKNNVVISTTDFILTKPLLDITKNIIYDERGMNWLPYLDKKILKYSDKKYKNFILEYSNIYHRVNKIISISNTTNEYLYDNFCLPRNKLLTIPNFIDFNNHKKDNIKVGKELNKVYKKFYIPTNKFIIGWVGTIISYEGLDDYINYIKFFTENYSKDIFCIIVGDVPNKESRYLDIYKEQVNKLNLNEYFLFTGRISHEECCIIENIFDIFVLPRKNWITTQKIMPLKIFSIAQKKCCMLSSDLEVIREIIPKNREYMLYDHTKEDFCKKLNYLKNNPKKRKELGDYLYDIAKKNYSYECVKNDYYKLIDSFHITNYNNSYLNKSLLNFVHPNQYFDKIYIITIDKESKKFKRSLKSLKILNIEYEVIDGINGKIDKDCKIILDNYKPITTNNRFSQYFRKKISTLGEIGYIKSYIKIINNAKKNQYKKILILDDDILLDIENFLIDFQKVNKINKNWKLLYLGASQHRWLEKKDGIHHDIHNINDYFYLPERTSGSFAIGIDISVFDEVLELLNNFQYPADIELQTIQEKYYGQCFVFYPNIIYADLGDSSTQNYKRNIEEGITKRKWNVEKYNNIIKRLQR